jgi:hypothetical protein
MVGPRRCSFLSRAAHKPEQGSCGPSIPDCTTQEVASQSHGANTQGNRPPVQRSSHEEEHCAPRQQADPNQASNGACRTWHSPTGAWCIVRHVRVNVWPNNLAHWRRAHEPRMSTEPDSRRPVKPDRSAQWIKPDAPYSKLPAPSTARPAAVSGCWPTCSSDHCSCDIENVWHPPHKTSSRPQRRTAQKQGFDSGFLFIARRCRTQDSLAGSSRQCRFNCNRTEPAAPGPVQ